MKLIKSFIGWNQCLDAFSDSAMSSKLTDTRTDVLQPFKKDLVESKLRFNVHQCDHNLQRGSIPDTAVWQMSSLWMSNISMMTVLEHIVRQLRFSVPELCGSKQFAGVCVCTSCSKLPHPSWVSNHSQINASSNGVPLSCHHYGTYETGIAAVKYYKRHTLSVAAQLVDFERCLNSLASQILHCQQSVPVNIRSSIATECSRSSSKTDPWCM